MEIDGYKPKPTDIWSIGICLYSYIEGSLPFYSENEVEMQTNAQEKDVDIPNSFSPELANLIRIMLAKSPEKRPTIVEVKSHPWFG